MTTLPLPQRDDAWRRRLDLGRLARLRIALAAADCAAGVFHDPINIRYATGTSNMQVYSLHNPCRYAFVATDGPVVLFDFKGCGHLSDGCAAVDEVRDASAWYHFNSGPRAAEHAGAWAAEIVDLVARHGGGNRRVAFDRLDPMGTHLIEAAGLTIVEGQEIAHAARRIKVAEEIEALRDAVAVCQEGIRRMIEQGAPGMSEQEIWSLLHQTNIAHGGEWIETRLLSSGPRTNPWYQEAGGRRVAAGDMISLDSDLVGPHGYSADISRSWIAGDVRPNAVQRRLYALAHEQVMRNVEAFAPGRTFYEVADRAFVLPDPFSPAEIPAIAHGIGLCNEFPLVMHERWAREKGHDGVIEPGMVMCVESYVGEPGGHEGVKLEQQILITQSGVELMSDLPFEEAFL